MSLRSLAGCIERQHATGLQFPQPRINTVRRGHVVMPHVECERVAIDLCLELRVLLDGFQFGSKYEGVAHAAVVKWLDAEPVPDQVQFSLLTVPQSEGEHSDEALN